MPKQGAGQYWTFAETVTGESGFVGNLTGNLTGNVTGDLTGTVTGGITGSSAPEVADPGNGQAIPVATSGVVHLVTGGAETRTVADPAAVGLRLSLFLLTDGGNCVVTFASPVNVAGNNTLTLADVTEAAHFVSVRDGASAYRWAVVGSDLDNGAFSTV